MSLVTRAARFAARKRGDNHGNNGGDEHDGQRHVADAHRNAHHAERAGGKRARHVVVGAGEDGQDNDHREQQDDAHDAQQGGGVAHRVLQLGERAALAFVVAPEAAQHALGTA